MGSRRLLQRLCQICLVLEAGLHEAVWIKPAHMGWTAHRALQDDLLVVGKVRRTYMSWYLHLVILHSPTAKKTLT